MPRVLLVAATTGYQTRSFTEAARRLGIDVLLATDRCHVLENPWRDNAIPVRFEEPEAAANLLAASSVDGVVAVADRPTLVAALTAQKLGLLYHPPRAVAACRDKHRMRQIVGLAGMPAPEHFRAAQDRRIHGRSRTVRVIPAFWKPLGLSASRGVIRANNPDEFVAATSNASAGFCVSPRSGNHMRRRTMPFRSNNTSKAANSRSKETDDAG